ncbi:hypothetical protein LOZ66_004187 [Ophidiomyces ophidiicola]|nr:hypothetical protein LOZ66_004187 [Ophidiomyces ophidiicola]
MLTTTTAAAAAAAAAARPAACPPSPASSSSPASSAASSPFARHPHPHPHPSLLPYLAGPSSLSSSPVFSALASPPAAAAAFDFSFWPEESMLPVAASLPGLRPPPVKLDHFYDDDAAAFDPAFDAPAPFLLHHDTAAAAGLPFDDSDDAFAHLLAPAKRPPPPLLFPGISHRRAASGSSVLSPPSISTSAASASARSSPALTPYAPFASPARPPARLALDAGAGDGNMRKSNNNTNNNNSNNYSRPPPDAHQRPQPPPARSPATAAAATDEPAGFYSLLPPSASSASHNSPATPQASFADDLDELSKSLSHGEPPPPLLDRWSYSQPTAPPDLSSAAAPRLPADAYADELYSPALAGAPPPPPDRLPSQPRLEPAGYAPYRGSVMANCLQAAQQSHMTARAHSPGAHMARQRSPFRHGSPYAYSSAAPLAQPPHAASALRGMALIESGAAPDSDEPKTISPKDALLDYHDDDASLPLFPPPPEPAQFTPQQPFRLSNFPPLPPFPPRFHPAPPDGSQYYMPQPPPQPQPPPPPQQQQPHQPMRVTQAPPPPPPVHHTPDFPPSLESTNSDRTPGILAAPGLRPPPHSPIKRPRDPSSDSGTYSCTYHGCAHRFETPAKLQKHKREAHRQTTPGTHGLARDGSGVGGAATATVMLRGSQAGPHKCERINPSTGKPCNSIFSRPYDLTRHEDTIHNARKQKVRCHLCSEEKTFSRNDALTRHMRVVHPDVSWPGKQRRRGRD